MSHGQFNKSFNKLIFLAGISVGSFAILYYNTSKKYTGTILDALNTH